jgi:hypothetical protein
MDRAQLQTCLQANGYLWQELALKFRVPLGHIPRRPNFVCSDFMCFAARENRDGENRDGNVELDRLLAVTRMYRHFCRDKTA